MKNNIHKYRKSKSMTQKQLADAAKTSQQQIQRLESGVQSPRFNTAVKICNALEVPMPVLFPDTKKTLKDFKPEEAQSIFRNEKLVSGLTEAGIDMEAESWTAKIMLKNGHNVFHPISSHEKDRLWKQVQEESKGPNFIVYDTDTKRIGLNLTHAVCVQFLFDPPEHATKEKQTDKTYIHTTAQTKALEFKIDPDSQEIGDEDIDQLYIQLQDVFFTIDLAVDGTETISFCDEDGEYAFFRLEYVSMIEVPLNLVEPKLYESELEGDEEEEMQEEEELA
jgi:transcriptional regulator with XRE-family HTH domain